MQDPDVTILKGGLATVGGLEKSTWQIARALCNEGLFVRLLTTGEVPSLFKHPNLEIVSFPIHYPVNFMNVYHFDQACVEYLEKKPSKLVLGLDRNRFQTHLRAGNGVHAAYLQHRVQQEGKIKQWSFQVNPLHHLLLQLEKKAFEHKDLQKLITNSSLVKEEILKFYKVDENKISVIHNGVEWTQMQASFDRWSSVRSAQAERLGLNLQNYQFLFVGNNYTRKGLIPLLEGLQALPARNFELSVIGRDSNIPYFQKKAISLKLHHHVHFFHLQRDLTPFFQVADALVVPSTYDPFANVTVEGLAMGLFVVSSRHNGGYEVLSPQNGCVIPSLSDVSSVAHSLQIAFNHPKTLLSSEIIRNSVKHLDFPLQLARFLKEMK